MLYHSCRAIALLGFLAVQPPLCRDVAVGDSITRGWPDSIGRTSYPARLGAVNLGVPGYTSAQVLWYEIGPAVDRATPGATLYVLAGTNDALLGIPVETTEANLRQIVTIGHQNGFRVVLLTIPPATSPTRPPGFDNQRAQENGWIMSGASGAEVACDAGNAPGLSLGPDGIHPDGPGYAALATAVEICRGSPRQENR